MGRNQSSGPDEAPETGEATDVEAAVPAAREGVESPEDAAAYSEVETDPLGGTGGRSAGGAG